MSAEEEDCCLGEGGGSSEGSIFFSLKRGEGLITKD